ncbi:MAG: hypothetical protein HY518_00810 [Candidatus Aenigmarchaeota archaeon]|nr:hypothetical protein [Candidatus Aenigmarchaeota archaeon]
MIVISYTVDNAVFRSDSVSFFFTEFQFDNEVDMSVKVMLPPGSGIYNDEYKPADAIITSDGRRIILAWHEEGVKGTLFSVKYSELAESGIDIFAVIAVIALAIVIFGFIRFRKMERQAFLHGFREDEKKTIQYLEQRKTALQSDLQKEFRFSRAKATRIVMHLEEKGLVRKQRYGRTNRLSWLKGNYTGKKVDTQDDKEKLRDASNQEKNRGAE